jgi:hypothetical protein
MQDLVTTLSHFPPISLEEMDHVQLLNRIDTKFVIHENQLKEFLTAIEMYYNVLVINDVSLHPYETLYFDTPGLKLYHMHHNGKLNRYKLRCRKYVNSGISFFEIKTKTNTSRTIKKRMPIEYIPEALDAQMNQYIREHTPGKLAYYIPVLRVYFDRITLVNKKANERLTFDINLRYKSSGSEVKIPDLVIVEIKQEKCSVSPFRQLMKEHRHPINYLSKYCLGLTCLNSELKKNSFKHKISTLNKLGYDIH